MRAFFLTSRPYTCTERRIRCVLFPHMAILGSMNASLHAITKLTLENFRNYQALTLDVPPRPVVLVGHNGAGKTNILEAISLLAPGRGLRSAKLRVMDFNPSFIEHTSAESEATTSPWVVSARVVTPTETSQIGTARDGQSAIEKRLIKMNGEKIRTQATLAKAICVQWLTPAMNQVFIEGNTARRKLLDRLVYGFDPEHAVRVTAYDLAMRERNRLLADRCGDAAWLTVLERHMAEHGVAMTLARQETIARINTAMQDEMAGFPTGTLRLTGSVETALAEGASALEAESILAARLLDTRTQDSRSGRANVGAHRSRLEVIHTAKGIEMEFCSTGEQKAVLLSLMLAAAQARARWCRLAPILLLDEIIAHLDRDRRSRLFDLIVTTGIQAWMTGTDAADFQDLSGFVTILGIRGNALEIERSEWQMATDGCG